MVILVQKEVPDDLANDNTGLQYMTRVVEGDVGNSLNRYPRGHRSFNRYNGFCFSYPRFWPMNQRTPHSSHPSSQFLFAEGVESLQDAAEATE